MVWFLGPGSTMVLYLDPLVVPAASTAGTLNTGMALELHPSVSVDGSRSHWVRCVRIFRFGPLTPRFPGVLFCFVAQPTLLYYTILYYTILYYTILYYTILYYTILYYTILYYTMLCYAMLCYTIYSILQSLRKPNI